MVPQHGSYDETRGLSFADNPVLVNVYITMENHHFIEG
jgi:hypothetical protein